MIWTVKIDNFFNFAHTWHSDGPNQGFEHAVPEMIIFWFCKYGNNYVYKW